MTKIDNSFIDDSVFKSIIKNIPLVSLDFVIKYKEKILLGRRVNRPAKGYWFTIGGRIHKNEKIIDAMYRIAREGAGVQSWIKQVKSS